MDPLNLRKQLNDNTFDLEQYSKDIRAWGAEMKDKEELLKMKQEKENNKSKKDSKPTTKKSPKVDSKKKSPKVDSNKAKEVDKTIPKDYNYWDKFDADAECEKVDTKSKEASDSEELSDEMDEEIVDLAFAEKDKGNKFFSSNRFEDAIKCYTKAIQMYAYEPAFYCNRALCHLKCEQYKSAESDCTTAIQIDNKYIKAFHRRALARDALGQYIEAKADLHQVLHIEPTNQASRELMAKINLKLFKGQDYPTIDTQRPVSKFTMSRQKNSGPISDYQIPSTSKQYVEPVYNRVFERKQEPIQSKKYAVKKPIIKELRTDITKNKNKEINDIKNDAQVKITEVPDIPPKQIIDNIDKKIPFSNLEVTCNKTQTQNNSDCTKDQPVQWPTGDNVETVNVINKPPNQRSKERLRRSHIYDVNLNSDISQLFIKPISTAENVQGKENIKINKSKVLNIKENDDDMLVESKYIKTAENEFKSKIESINCNVDLCNEDFNKLNLPVPTTSLQFYLNWKSVKNDNELRFLYLRQINPTLYTDIFKDSLETKVFSEIIEVLSETFIERNIDVFPYLLALTRVKRFSTMVMFKSAKDKSGLLSLIAYMYINMKEDGRSEEVIDYLNKKYEL